MLTTFAGLANFARPPPFNNSKFFLTVFNSWIFAPLLAIAMVTLAISSMVIGGSGNGSRAEPPPVT